MSADIQNLFTQVNSPFTKLSERIQSPFAADEESPYISYIFISCAHADRDRVNPIITRLYEQGWLIWYDEGLTIGEDYYECLVRHIRDCAVMLLFVSERSMSNESYIRKEITFADRCNKPVIKCFLDSDVILPPDIALTIGDDRKYPRCVESELETVLSGIDVRIKTAPRKASEITIYSPGETIELASTDDEYDFDVLSDNTVRLKEYKGSDVDVTVPAVYKGKKVVELFEAFKLKQDIRSVTIPYGVKCIGYWAFSDCAKLTNIVIPDSVTEIGDFAFSGCTNLMSIVIPDSVMKIGENAFRRCTKLSSIVIPDSVTEIGEFAFSLCTGLTNIVIPSSVTKIDSGTFWDCANLTDIVIPDSVTEIGYAAFKGCTKLSGIVLPGSVAEIGKDAFEGCTKLSSIVIPESVTGIGDWAFNCCTGLTNIVIPDSVAEIGDKAFSGCTNLTNISVDDNNAAYCSEDGILFGRDKTRLICFPAGKNAHEYLIPSSVTKISVGAFYGCAKLSSVVIPDGITEIGRYTLRGCTNLSGIVIPDGVTKIGCGAFAGCASLTSVVIPDGVTEIGEDTFAGCDRLTVYCGKDSCAWQYCKRERIPCKDISGSRLVSAIRSLLGI